MGNYRQTIEEWINDFQMSKINNVDRHITDFYKSKIEKKDWIKKGLLLSNFCQSYINLKKYNIFVYTGFSLKDRRKGFIPRELNYRILDRWTPPFILLSKIKIEEMDDYMVAYALTGILQRKTFFWQYKELGVYSTNIYVATVQK